MNKPKKVMWTLAEKTAVFRHMEDIFAQDPKMAQQTALTRAQTALPYDRRLVVSAKHTYNHRVAIEAARTRAAARTLSASAAPPVATPVPAAPAKPKEDPSDRLVEAFTLLLDVIEAKIAARIENAVTQAVRADRPRHDPSPLAGVSEARPGVLVVGLLPAQANVIESMYKRRFDLTFLESEDAVRRDPIRRAHTILMTKFISHAVQEKYRKAPGLQFCNGGNEALMQILDELLRG